MNPKFKTNRQKFSLELFLRDSLSFLVLWIILHLLIRIFAYFSSNPSGSGLSQIIICGILHDIIGFAFIWFFWTAIQLLFQKSLIARYSSLVVLSLTSVVGIVNAIFISWSHEPLNYTFLTYVKDLQSLSASGAELLPPWYWIVAFGACLIALFFVAGLYTRQSGIFFSKIKPYYIYVTWLGLGIIALISLLLNLNFQFNRDKHAKAITFNVISHQVFFIFDSIKTDATLAQDTQRKIPVDASFVRNCLVHDQGCFKFLDENLPLVKYNFSFSKPGKRKGIWDRKLKIRPNIFILFMESFRAHDIGVYGSDKGLTPVFDSLARNGWLWTNFYATGVQTPRAALSTLCSIYPYIGESIQRSNPNLPLRGLPSILEEYGYQTEFCHNGRLKFDNKIPFFSNLGFKNVFGKKDLDPEGKFGIYGWGFPDVKFAKLIANRLNNQDPNTPLFLTAFTVSHHHPWHVPDPKFKIVKEIGANEYSRFKNSMHYSDYALSVFFQNLKDDVLNRTICFILADTAQPMGEHQNNFALIHYLYEENLRIPFLIYAPGFIKGGRTFSEIASQVDIMPTILDMLNIKCLNHTIGRSLLSEIEIPFAFFSNPYFEVWTGIRAGKYKFIHQFNNGKDFLYDLELDPLETTNIAFNNTRDTAALKKITFAKNNATQFLVREKRIWKNPGRVPINK